MKKFAKGLFVLLFAVVLATFTISCASDNNASGDTQKKEKANKKAKFDQAIFDAAYANGDYLTCISQIGLKKDKDDVIMDRLNVNMLQYFMKDYETSGRSFFETQGEMELMSADTSAGKVLGAALGGEKNVNYAGAVYERILTYTMRIVNSISAGKMDEAQGVVNNYTGNFKDVLSELVLQQKAVAAESEGALDDPQVGKAMDALKEVGVDLDIAKFKEGMPPKSDVYYETSPFLSYLGALVAASNDKDDHAEQFVSIVKSKYPDFDASEDLNIPAGKGRLNILSLAGTIGKREDSNLEKILIFTIEKYGFSLPVYFKFSYPVFDPDKQSHPIKSVRVKLSNGDEKNAMIIENFDEAVAIDVASKARGAFNRSIFRSIVKAAAVIPTNMVALETAQGVLDAAAENPIALKVAEVGMKAAVDALAKAIGNLADREVADTRQCAYFPNFASTAGFTVDPGTYTVTVEYLDGETVVDTKVLENVVVEEGKLSVQISSCEK